MTIECYYGDCPHHGTRLLQPEEGPFCFQEECKASKAELQRWAIKRELEVKAMQARASQTPTTHKKE